MLNDFTFKYVDYFVWILLLELEARENNTLKIEMIDQEALLSIYYSKILLFNPASSTLTFFNIRTQIVVQYYLLICFMHFYISFFV